MALGGHISDIWTERLLRLAPLICGAVLLGAFVSLLRTSGTGDAEIDFRVFWTAGGLALSEGPVAVFDDERMRAVATHQDGWFPFAYPPGFLALVTPLALLPFSLAWLVFVMVSVIALCAAAVGHARVWSADWLILAFAPAYLPALVIGQTSALWFAGLVAALAALFDGRKVLAGVFIGLLTLKPQLGLLIPLALIFAGEWRTFVAATLTTLGLAGLPTLWATPSYWLALKETWSEHGAVIVSQIDSLPLMVSPMSFMAWLGAGPVLSLVVQIALALVAVALIFLAWRGADGSRDLRAATLLIGIGMASPYLWYYESALLAPLAFFLARSGQFGRGYVEQLLLVLFWIGGAPFVISQLINPDVPQIRSFLTPLMVIALAATALAVYRYHQSHPVKDPVPS